MNGEDKSTTYSRRKDDPRGAAALQRNLDWGKQATDVDLHQQSPLVISDALGKTGSLIRLTPSSVDQLANAVGYSSVGDDVSDKVTSIQSAQSRKAESGVTNLLTLHSPEKLRERCKVIAVQSALVRKKNEKRLYLAACMVHWTPGKRNDDSRCSPLLFYPVNLITEESPSSSSGFVHKIAVDCDGPEFNFQLATEMEKSLSITIPSYDGTKPLSDYLSEIEKLFTDTPLVNLEYRMAIGLASAPAGITTAAHHEAQALSKLPKHFEPVLAKKLIADLGITELQTTLSLISASNDFLLAENSDATDWPETPDITEVREYSTLLEQHGLGDVKFHGLPDLPERIQGWITDVQPVLKSDFLEEQLQQRDISAVHLMKLAGIVELLDKAPENLGSHVHRDLAYQGTPLLFRRAKYQARLIEEQMNQLREHFYLDRVPPKPQLLQLLDELASGEHNAIEIVDSDYFHARRRFMELSIEKPGTLNDEHKRQLNQLVKVLRFRELFVNNTEYRLALGPAYRGLRTDWDALEEVINYAQEFAEVISSESIAANALADWSNFHRTYMENLDKLHTAGRGIRKLLKIVRPLDHKTSATEVLIKGGWISDQLNEWNLDYGLMTNFGDKTPNDVLHIFSGKSRVDQETEQHVRIANSLLQNFLMDTANKKAILKINATLTWLNDALAGERANRDEIEAIINRAGELALTKDSVL